MIPMRPPRRKTGKPSTQHLTFGRMHVCYGSEKATSCTSFMGTINSSPANNWELPTTRLCRSTRLSSISQLHNESITHRIHNATQNRTLAEHILKFLFFFKKNIFFPAPPYSYPFIDLSFLPTPMLARDLLLALVALMMAKESELFAPAFSPANALLRLGRPGCCRQNF